MKLVIFIDFDNLEEIQRKSSLKDSITRILALSPIETFDQRGNCEVRIYGGWYEGTQLSKLGQDLTVQIQNDFPTIINIQNLNKEPLSLLTSAQLAFALMEEPSHHLFDTLRKKGRPRNLKVATVNDVGCSEIDCPLPLLKKIVKTGKCSFQACNSKNEDVIFRQEQKLVDTMLACDLVFASNQGYGEIILVSGDDDFVPPLRTILLKRKKIIRVLPRVNNLKSKILINGAELREVYL